ncbi:MAG: glycoside hydrolase family 97 catalytic domain-containing protein, partial [Prevotella sp.]
MRKIIIMLLCCVSSMAMAQQAKSPNGKLTLNPQDGGYVVCFEKQPVLQLTRLGIGNASLQDGQKMKPTGTVKADYTMLQGKRLHCTNKGNEYRLTLDANTDMVLRLYDDGLAFRYELSNLREADMPRELTTYRIAEGTRRWMQQWSDGYEGFFPLTTSYKTKAERGFSAPSLSKEGFNNRWGYPCLLEPADGVFVLLSEANIERRQSASCLFNEGELFTVTADENKVKLSGAWHTPWRVAIIGTLAQVVGSTLVTDVSEPNKLDDTSWIHPGVVSWVYWAYNHGSNDYEIIKKYVDMAATLRLPYVLIDAEWDEMKDGKTVEDAVNYAKSKNVRPMIWYNSSVGWVNGAPGPKFRLNKPEDRDREFAWCEKIGVAGVKIDFFSGDNQLNMDYCIDLLESAARHHLLVNFHGATIPRGWQRTYPNLLSTEAVYGAEWYNNVGTFTKKAAAHNATLPFTRNVIGPMDYTPCAFSDSQHPHITSNAHELALTVLYESALQ